jgi:hypothetical protein
MVNTETATIMLNMLFLQAKSASLCTGVMDLIGAEAVLAELEMLTPAQFSAVQECHRVNVRRLRQRFIIDLSRWVTLFTVIAGVSAALVEGAKKSGNWSGSSGAIYCLLT